MRHINFFLGAQNGASWVGGKKFMFKKFMCFFCPLERKTCERSSKTGEGGCGSEPWISGLRVSCVVAHDCGYPLSRYTCRATRVAADFLDFRAFCRCSTGVALHPLKILVSHLPPPPVPRGVAPKFGSEKVSRYTGVSQLQLRVSRYTVQLRFPVKDFCPQTGRPTADSMRLPRASP